jgi:hypothetical protein
LLSEDISKPGYSPAPAGCSLLAFQSADRRQAYPGCLGQRPLGQAMLATYLA